MNNLYKYKNINANLFIYQKYFKIYLSMYSVINLKKIVPVMITFLLFNYIQLKL